MRQQLPPIQDKGTVIYTTSGAVRQENIKSHNELQRRATQERLEAERRRLAAQPKGICPFSTAINATCLSDCALLTTDGRCSLRREATADTQGKRCPISHSKCSNHCALYFNGCGLTSIFTTKGE